MDEYHKYIGEADNGFLPRITRIAEANESAKSVPFFYPGVDFLLASRLILANAANTANAANAADANNLPYCGLAPGN